MVSQWLMTLFQGLVLVAMWTLGAVSCTLWYCTEAPEEEMPHGIILWASMLLFWPVFAVVRINYRLLRRFEGRDDGR